MKRPAINIMGLCRTTKGYLHVMTTLLALTMGCAAGYGENWMQRLPGDTYVAVVSIPGTHDAATGCGWLEGYEDLGNAFAKTQDISIGQQWTIGIRAFDLRPCVYEGYMNLNHGIMPTKVHFEDVLCQLRDSLTANPSEFVVIHLLHEDDGDQIEDVYNQRLIEVLTRDDLKDRLVDFKPDLTVDEARGKILILSRDNYGKPIIGGIMKNWTGEAVWSKQTGGRIQGPGKDLGYLFMQDYSDTHKAGGINTKINAIRKMLEYSTTHLTKSKSSIRWIYNFASAYSKVENIFGMEVSSSEGYRDNATHTHATIIDYLNTHQAGPTGIILMDFAGVDSSEGYEVRGAELVRTIIDNNFRYLQDATSISIPTDSQRSMVDRYDLTGRIAPTPQQGINIIRFSDGSSRKVVSRAE